MESSIFNSDISVYTNTISGLIVLIVGIVLAVMNRKEPTKVKGNASIICICLGILAIISGVIQGLL